MESVTEVLIEHGPHAVVEAWELASWGTQQLGWRLDGGRVDPGVELAWQFEGPAGPGRLRVRRLDEGPADIRRLRLDCKLAECPAAMDLVVEENNQRLAVRWQGGGAAPRTLALPPHSPAELIGRQLSDRERDPVFHESMAVAQVMARSLLE
jgi:hypothetical protein